MASPTNDAFAGTSSSMETSATVTTTAKTTSSHEKEEEHRDSEETSSLALPESRLEDIWDAHLQQYLKVDALEKRIDEHAVRLRRRISNLLDIVPSHRLSHMRLFVSHHARSSSDTGGIQNSPAAVEPASEASKPSAPPMDTISKTWTLVVEGKLLIGHLDHESARNFDERLKREFQKRHKVSADHPSMTIATSARTSSTDPTEEETPVEPLQFTHFFDKLVVQFQTIYQPAVGALTTGASTTGASGTTLTPKATTSKSGDTSSGKKKSRGAKRQKTTPQEIEVQEQIDPRLLTFSDPTEFIWNKTVSTLANPAAATADSKSSAKPGGVTTTQTTPDAHAFYVHYDPPPSPSSAMKLYGAIATVQLYPTRGPEQRYKPSKEFAKAFFAKHVDATAPPILPTTAIAEAKKVDEEQESSTGDSNTPSKYKKKTVNTVPSNQTGPMMLENEIHVPTSFTMKEIITSLFTYIQDKKLTSEEEPTLIQNDKTLQSLFQCETMRFHELQTLLMQNKLILLLPKPAPITFKYVIKDVPKKDEDYSDVEEPEDVAAPMTMDLHNDVYVPNLFPYRARELMRRIKRREVDYVSTRTKARYLVMASRAKDESAVKAKIEEAICGTTMGEWPILACLAKAAPAHSEARKAAMLDAKIAYLLQQVEQSQQAAQQAWDLVNLLRDMVSKENLDMEVENAGHEMAMNETEKQELNDAMDVDTPQGTSQKEQEKLEDTEETDV